jgi:hypothetical protein
MLPFVFPWHQCSLPSVLRFDLSSRPWDFPPLTSPCAKFFFVQNWAMGFSRRLKGVSGGIELRHFLNP